jgi:hypothetical protein
VQHLPDSIRRRFGVGAPSHPDQVADAFWTFTGATAPVAGMRINYGGPGGFQVVGDIDRNQPVWRVFFQGAKSIALEQVDVAVAWF